MRSDSGDDAGTFLAIIRAMTAYKRSRCSPERRPLPLRRWIRWVVSVGLLWGVDSAGTEPGVVDTAATCSRSVEGNTLPSSGIPSQPARTVTDLPLIELRPSTASTDTLALILSGDGGWTGIDQALAADFAKHGIAVVGLSSPRYFWTPRTPAGAAQDLERLLDSYLAHWCKQRVILVGFSTGADVLPFLVNRWPPTLIRRLQVVALLGPSPVAAFEFHLLDWVRYKPLPSARPVPPEIQQLKGLNLLCLYGEQDHGALCPALDADRVKIIHVRGGHHFAGDYSTVAKVLLKESREPGVSTFHFSQ